MSRPWMPLYVGNYIADTQHLTTLEHGAYMLLLMHYWMHGGLPSDEKRLSLVAKLDPKTWRKVRPILAAFFTPDWRHKRVDEELAKASEISEINKANARRRWSGRNAKADATASATAMPEGVRKRCLSQSQSQSPSETNVSEESGIATEPSASEPRTYAFESGVIRLNEADLAKWVRTFAAINVEAELYSLADWAGKQPNWFNAVAGALAKKDREARAALEKARAEGAAKAAVKPAPSGRPVAEGYL